MQCSTLSPSPRSSGDIVARYRATHLAPDGVWAKAGDQFVIAPTSIGRVALVLGDELAVPEVFGMMSLASVVPHRPDSLGLWQGAVLETDPKLFNQPYPAGTPFAPWAAAALGQFWVAAAGWAQENKPAAWLRVLYPAIATVPRAAGPGTVAADVTAPWVRTRINQSQLIDGQEPGGRRRRDCPTTTPAGRRGARRMDGGRPVGEWRYRPKKSPT